MFKVIKKFYYLTKFYFVISKLKRHHILNYYTLKFNVPLQAKAKQIIRL